MRLKYPINLLKNLQKVFLITKRTHILFCIWYTLHITNTTMKKKCSSGKGLFINTLMGKKENKNQDRKNNQKKKKKKKNQHYKILDYI